MKRVIAQHLGHSLHSFQSSASHVAYIPSEARASGVSQRLARIVRKERRRYVMNGFVKLLVPSTAATLVAALLLFSSDGVGPNGPRRLSGRTAPAEILVAQRAPLPTPDPRVDLQDPRADGPHASESCSHGSDAHGHGESGGHVCGAPTAEAQREFVEQVRGEMAKLGIDASTNPDFPTAIPGGPECAPVRTPTRTELEQMRREFAETERVLSELATQSPRDSQPTTR